MSPAASRLAPWESGAKTPFRDYTTRHDAARAVPPGAAAARASQNQSVPGPAGLTANVVPALAQTRSAGTTTITSVGNARMVRRSRQVITRGIFPLDSYHCEACPRHCPGEFFCVSLANVSNKLNM